MRTTGLDIERCTAPPSQRVYAPEAWRGSNVHIILPENNSYMIHSHPNRVVVTAEAAYQRLARLSETGQGPPQLSVQAASPGDTVLLVRNPETDPMKGETP